MANENTKTEPPWMADAHKRYCEEHKIHPATLLPLDGSPAPEMTPYPDADCGKECHWTERYGFVPECGCPVHDPSAPPGFHYCPDWDGLLIHSSDPEAECCTCPK